MDKRRIFLLAILLFLGVVGGWRLWPCSFEEVLGVDPQEVERLAASVTVSGLEEGGETSLQFYSLPNLSPQMEDFHQLLDRLCSSRYRQDLRNLLPWPVTRVEGDRWRGRRSVRIFLVWGPEEEQTAYLSLSGRQITLALGEGDGLRVFHPTDPQLIDWLAEYLEEHGVLQSETTSG